jgi:hypothetical protein
VTQQQDDTRYRQLTEGDSHQLGIERHKPNFESTRDFSKNRDRFFPIGVGDDYPGDESKGNSHESVSDHGDEEEGVG